MASSNPQQPSTDKDSAAPVSLIAAFGGVSKKRSSHACQCCSKRKLRCDVASRGVPCSNCTTAALDCVVVPVRRRRNLYSRMAEATAHEVEKRNAWPEPLMRGPASSRSGQAIFDLVGMLGLEHAQLESAGAPTFITTRKLDEQDTVQRNREVDISHINTSSPPKASARQVTSFLKPLPVHIDDNDIEYLWIKGSLTIPLPELRHELLISYIDHIHSAFPILDLDDFRTALEFPPRGEGRELSLLLFQAMMFSATAFIDIRHLHSAGFSDRKAARRAFYQKARALYDLDCETDPIVVLQALLLIAFWYNNGDDQKDQSYWMALIISLSQRLELHVIHTYEGLDPRKQRLYRRIAWYCFIRDQQIALALTRPPTMKSTHHTIPMLTLEDFELEPIREHHSDSEVHFIRSCSFARQRKLAILCIETAKLSVCMSHILETQHKVKQFSNGSGGTRGPTYKHAMLQARDDIIAAEGRRRCDAELQSWFSECTQGRHYTESLIFHLLEDDDSVMVHRAMLHCLYYTAVCALHQAPFDNPSFQTAAEKELSYQKTQQAAFEISNIVQEIQRLDLVALVPTYGSTPVLYAIMAHLRGMKSQHEAKRRAGWDAFNTCIHMIRLLAESYHGAEAIFQLLAATSQRTNLIPKTIEELEPTTPYDAQHSRSPECLAPEATAQVNNTVSGFSPGIGALDMVALNHHTMDMGFAQLPTACASNYLDQYTAIFPELFDWDDY